MIEGRKSHIQAAKVSFLHGVVGLSLRERLRSSDIQREFGVESLLLCIERRPAEVLRASDQAASWARSIGGFLGMSNWKETPGKTQNKLEKSYRTV